MFLKSGVRAIATKNSSRIIFTGERCRISGTILRIYRKMQPVSLPFADRAALMQNGKCLLDVTLSNWQGGMALLAHLQLRQATSGHRVLPVYYSDNYRQPGARRVAKDQHRGGREGDLHGETPLVVLDGWNGDDGRPVIWKCQD